MTAPPQAERPSTRSFNGEECLYGGVLFPQFGHFLLETLSRLWPTLYQRFDRILFLGNPEQLKSRYVGEFLDLLGLNVDSGVSFITRPTIVHSLHVPQRAFGIHMYGSDAYREIALKIRAAAGCGNAPADRKIYLSRSRFDGRPVVDESDIEAVFIRHGFEIYHPQEHSIADQIRTLNQGRHIAGSAGSALHMAMFTTGLEIVDALTTRPRLADFATVSALVGYSLRVVGAPAGYSRIPNARPTYYLEPERFNFELLMRQLSALGYDIEGASQFSQD